MKYFLDNRFAPITDSIGLINATLQETKQSFVLWSKEILAKHGQDVIELPLQCGLDEAISELVPLSSPVPTRYLLLGLGDKWTALFDNGKLGTDAEPTVSILSQTLPARGLCLTVAPNTRRVVNGKKRGTYGATIFQVFEGSTESRRSVACANDGGGWVFEEFGEPYAFEDIETYKSPKIRDRFSPELLARYVREFGIDPFSEASYLGQNDQVRGVVVETTGNLPKTLEFIGLEERRRALGLE